VNLLAVDVPWNDNGEYVFAAYAVFFVLILIYVAIIGMRVARRERELSDLLDQLEKRGL
jgi:CcmD family protein